MPCKQGSLGGTKGLAALVCWAMGLIVGPAPGNADEPLTLRQTWSGPIGFVVVGAAMAQDGPDVDTTLVDQLLHPATATLSAADFPSGAAVTQAFLYWSGSIFNDDCAGTTVDDQVTFTPPGGVASTVTADVCYCSDAAATSYDIQACRVDVTALLSLGSPVGTYAVDDFDALINNGATNNASFALVVVYRAPGQYPQRVALYDGVQTMWSSSNPTLLLTLGSLDVDDPPTGELTWYVVEGDVGGLGAEQVDVAGMPGGLSLTLSDALNPVDNPMNHTINTSTPPQTDTIGVDIDRFDISGALTAGDTAVDMTYQAGQDKWWLVFNMVSVRVFEPVLGTASTKTGVLWLDPDGNGVPSPGDTVRYTITLENTGTAPAQVDVTDDIPAEAASWTLVDSGGGSDASTAQQLVVLDVPVIEGASVEVVLDVVLADVPDTTMIQNIAGFDAAPDGDAGTLASAPLQIRRDGDSDGVFDTEDNCPGLANPGQADADGDGAGDACDSCPDDATDDGDGDGVCEDVDNCPGLANPGQADADGDGAGDACDSCPDDASDDGDGDGVCEDVDNCPGLANPGQADADGDGIGDACEGCDDGDGDGVCEDVDNCPGLANSGQADADGDGAGDACDSCPDDATDDGDGDGVCEDVDNCPGLANPGQADADGDGIGDACEGCDDGDGDGVCEDVDNCPGLANPGQADADGDGIGDACEGCDDADGDGVCEDVDNCPGLANPDQYDSDADGVGDACEDATASDAGCSCSSAPSPASLLLLYGILLLILLGRRRRRCRASADPR